MTAVAWAAIAVFTVAYVLIATEKIHRVAAALGGAAVMFLIGATDTSHAFFSEEAGIDWNVIFLLVGMMLIVAVLKRTGGFEYVAVWASKRARGRPYRVMVILVLITAVASAALDNVTTVLLIAPVTFLVCERLGVPAAPFLIAEAMASNIGGTSTLVGDPPNIIIGSRGGLSYNDFLTTSPRSWCCCWWSSSACAGCCSETPSATTRTGPPRSPRCTRATRSATGGCWRSGWPCWAR